MYVLNYYGFIVLKKIGAHQTTVLSLKIKENKMLFDIVAVGN